MSNEFYINHAELPEEGREVEVSRNADWLTEILRDDVYVVRGNATITGLIRPVGGNVSIDLKVQVPLEYHCSRCGRENNFVYGTGIKHFFTTSESNKLDLPIEVARNLDAELEITEVNSKKFDAEPTIVETFAGELSIYPTCHELCEEAVAVTNLEPETESATDAQIDPRLAPLMAIREAMESGPNEAKA